LETGGWDNDMPNDAKLGLIAGVTVVLLIAAMFFRKEPGQSQAAAPPPVPTRVLPETKLPALVPAIPPSTNPQADYEFPPLPPPPPLSESVP
jgi:hypothetical protein